jgi:superfamily II DNA or RNA helicase
LKTVIALKVIKRALEKNPSRKVIIIVPKISLKVQWEKHIENWKLKNCTVYVVNTIIVRKLKLTCDLLVYDEFHTAGAESFIKVFDIIQYSWLLALTATIERLDGRHKLLLDKAPIVDVITHDEAVANEWISPITEYNLGIELTESDKAYYDDLNKRFHKLFSYFEHDFNLAMKCMTKAGSEAYANREKLDQKVVSQKAFQWNNAMRERKDYLYNLPSKVLVSKQIIDKFPVKTIVFAESTKFVDSLYDLIPNIAVKYHSNMESQIIDGKKYGAKKLRDLAIKKIKDNRYKERVIISAKSLNEGFDVPDIMLGIRSSFTRNPATARQIRGRVCRLFKDGTSKTNALFINIYVKGTQDEKWLAASQEDTDPIFIDSIDEIGKLTETSVISIIG